MIDPLPASSPPPTVAEAPRRGFPVTITTRTLWITTGIVATALVLAFVLAKALDVVFLVFIAIVLGESIRPIVTLLGKARIPRPLSVLLVYLVTGAVLFLLGSLFVQPLLDQVAALQQALPTYLAQLSAIGGQAQQAANGNPTLQAIFDSLKSQAIAEGGRLVPSLLSLPLGVINIVFSAVIVLTMAFFWLTSTRRLRPFVVSLFPPTTQERASDVISELGVAVGGYVRGLVINMVIVGTLSGLGLWLLGVPYALLLGIFAGFFEIVPFIGPYIGGAAAVLVASANGGWVSGGEVALLFVVIQQLESIAIVPLVMRGVVKLNPMLTIVALLVGASVLGFLGAVLAVPIALVLQILVVRVLAPVARSKANEVMEPAAQPVVVVPESTLTTAP